MSFERRKARVGRVISDKMDKSVVVLVEWRRTHPLYRKSMRRRSRLVAHDADNSSRTGDLIRIIESRPISKTKRWRVAEIISRQEIAEIQPDEITIDETVATAAGAREPETVEVAPEPAATPEPAGALEPVAVAEPEVEPEPAAVAELEVESEPVAVAEPEVESEPAAVAEPEVESEPVAVAEPEVESEPVAVAEPDIATEDDAGAVEAEPESGPAASADAEPQEGTKSE